MKGRTQEQLNAGHELVDTIEQHLPSDKELQAIVKEFMEEHGHIPEDTQGEANTIRGEVARHWINEQLRGGQPAHRLNLSYSIAASEETIDVLLKHINDNLDEGTVRDLMERAHGHDWFQISGSK